MASFNASSGPPFGFENVSEFDCTITTNAASDGEQLQKQVQEFITKRRERDKLHKQYRQKLMKIWELARQTKSGRNDHAEKLKDEITKLLPEIVTINQQCDGIYSSIYQQNKDQLCPLATCFWSPQDEVQFSCSVFSREGNIKFYRNEAKTFHDATVGYLGKNFKNLNRAYRVPSVLIMSDEFKQGTKGNSGRGQKSGGKIGKLSYYANQCLKHQGRLTEKDITEITSDRKGDCAVEDLVQKLISCEHELPGGMFVISNLQYQEYLAVVKDKEQLVTAQNGDHDIIVIHRKLGVIFFQVKGCTSESDIKTKHQAVNKALRQVMKDKFVFIESNRDLDFVHKSLRVYGFAALPNLHSVDLEKLNICSAHRENILTSSDMENLPDWLKERIYPSSNDKTEVIDEYQYKLICGRYVGLASMVSLRTYDDGINEIGKMVQAAFLTPAQLDIIRQRDKYFIISGDYGTGKSLVLAKKAERLVKEDDNCVAFIISCSDIDNWHLCKSDKPYRSAEQVNRFVNLKEGKDKKRIKILQFSDIFQKKGTTRISSKMFYETIISYITDFVEKNPNIKTHLFLDEVLLSLFDVQEFTSEPERSTVWDNIESALPEGSFCGMAISTYSYAMSKQLDPKGIASFLPINFELHILELIMRVPSRVCDLVKCIEDHTGNGFFDHSSMGHTFMGPMPLLSTLTECKCSSPTTLFCQCSQTRLLEVLHKVMERFNFKVHDVTIVIFLFHCDEYLLPLYRSFQAVVQNAFFKLGIKLEWETMYGLQIPTLNLDNEGEKEKIISVVDQHTFIGCESQNVIFIDMFGMLQWFKHMSEWFTFLVNRCASQYIHINWPESEARQQWHLFLDGYEKYCKAYFEDSQNDFKMELLTEIVNTARASDSNGGCVEKVKESLLIQEI